MSESTTLFEITCHGSNYNEMCYNTGGKPRNYHEIVLTSFCSQATSGTRHGSFQAENWIKKGWCHFQFCFILQLRTNNGEIRQVPCKYVSASTLAQNFV